MSAKLAPELVPEPLWDLSGYRLLLRPKWNRIRAATLEAERNTCAVCGVSADRRMICHERWQYEDSERVARLIGLEILCPACDSVHHMGQASVSGFFDEALQHMMRVNKITEKDVAQLLDRAFTDWKSRNSRKWTIHVDLALASRFPDLVVLEGLRGIPGEGQARVNKRKGSG